MMDKDEDDHGLLMRHRLKVYQSLFSRRLQRCLTKFFDDDLDDLLHLKFKGVKLILDRVV